MAKPVVFVIGATGLVGSATVQVLVEKYASQVEIRAGVRSPDKAEKLKAFSGVSVVKAEMGSTELKHTLKDVNALYIVTPPTENRAELAISTAEAAKEAGVKHLVVVSMLTADLQDTVFGRQFTELESGIKKLGVAYTVLRLPGFHELYLGFIDTIKGAGAIYGPLDPTKQVARVSAADIGKASAAVLVNPTKHADKTYDIISDRHTYGDVAAAFGEALGKTVTYNRVPYDAAKQGALDMGMLEWEVEGLMELFKLIDSASPVINPQDISHFHQITGEEPINLRAFVAQVKAAFQ